MFKSGFFAQEALGERRTGPGTTQNAGRDEKLRERLHSQVSAFAARHPDSIHTNPYSRADPRRIEEIIQRSIKRSINSGDDENLA
ncbi:MAG: hypothetical protein P4M11_15085 [Candidatus Pacebacteria bacterium]|nr:hypothetical protein [Candidatus Paceibacterota bacterium]